jgi:hypothetical protein
LFPDETSVWQGHPSIIDGIRNPHVLFLGAPAGAINFIVTGEGIGPEGFAVSASTHFYWVSDELDISVTAHGLPSLAFQEGFYVKRAIHSRLLETYRRDPALSVTRPNAMHFAFLGGDDCIEFVTSSEPQIAPLRSKADWNWWVQKVARNIADSFSAENSK